MLTDLDKLYIAMAEVGADRYFDTVCHGHNITSLDAFQDYNFKGSTEVDAAEMDIIKERLGHKYLNFKDLTKVTFTLGWKIRYLNLAFIVKALNTFPLHGHAQVYVMRGWQGTCQSTLFKFVCCDTVVLSDSQGKWCFQSG